VRRAGALPCRENGAVRIAVAGATGTVGRLVVEELRVREHELVPISRSSGVDLVSGDGLDEALEGVECVIDTSNRPSSQPGDATEFFVAVSRNLQEAGRRTGVQRLLVLSIIGCDRFRAGYYAAKAAHERTALGGPIPARILRAAQFHDYVARTVESGRQGDVSRVRRMRTQLVATSNVADALADLATGPLSEGGDIPEIAGPRAEELVEMAELLVAHRGDAIGIEPASDPHGPDHELYESGGLLPGREAMLVGPTFEDWLRGKL
jgi:uncharacterized protein YbjT (DUF2867 family)